MSALGQKRTSAQVLAMSALPLKADMAEGDLTCPLNALTGSDPSRPIVLVSTYFRLSVERELRKSRWSKRIANHKNRITS